jgi:hypothetical protein
MKTFLQKILKNKLKRGFVKVRTVFSKFLVVFLILIWLFNGWPVVFKKAKAQTFQMQVGYYVGTGATLSISGLGFQPQLVIIKADNTDGTGPIWKSSAMPSSNSAYFTATANDTGSVIQFNSDGFTVSASAQVNTANVVWKWIAFAGSDCSSNGTFCVGTYTGNGTATRTITTGFQPDLVWVKRSTAVAANWRSSVMPDNVGQFFINTNQDTTGALYTTLNSDGFTVGSTNNVSGGTYYYVAFKQVSGAMNVGSYTGNATDNRNITGVGFVPNFVFVKNANAATAAAGVFNITDSYGDYSSFFTDTASAVDHIQALQTDGFQVGASSNVNGSGNTIYYAAFGGAANWSASGTFKMTTGSYVGTGSSFSITGLGFAPDLVIIKDSAANYAVFRTRVMGGDSTAYFANAAANFTGGITALGTDGFTIGTSAIVNTAGNTYYWEAFGGAFNPLTNSGSADFAIGAYTGNGIDNRNIVRLPFQPNLVTVKRSGATAGAWRTSALSGDLSSFFAGTAETTNIIQALNSDGFQIGTAANVNSAANVYFWFAFKSGPNFAVGSYTGNGTSQNITSVGFQPDLVWVKRSTAVQGAFRPSSLLGNSTQLFLNVANITNAITGFISNGFSVGNAGEVNTSGGIYRYAAWKATYSFNQSAYRFFANQDSTDVGLPLGLQDTPITLISSGQEFRLRILIHNNIYLTSQVQYFKLQFGTSTGVSCTLNPPSSWVDVEKSTAIAVNDNPTPNDGSPLTANLNDPIHGLDTIRNQTYEEENPFTNSVSAINAGEDGKWDFSLKDNGAPANTTYCFRVVKDDGSLLDTYSVIPQITTAGAAPSVSCSLSSTSTSFGNLNPSSISTSSPNITITVSCSGTVSGCTVSVRDTGNGTNGGLYKSTSPTYLIPSPASGFPATATLSAGTEGYGIQVATTTAGSGGTLSLNPIYNQSGNTVGKLTTTTQVLASSTTDVSNREITITHKASISNLTPLGNYQDSIIYSCNAN